LLIFTNYHAQYHLDFILLVLFSLPPLIQPYQNTYSSISILPLLITLLTNCKLNGKGPVLVIMLLLIYPSLCGKELCSVTILPMLWLIYYKRNDRCSILVWILLILLRINRIQFLCQTSWKKVHWTFKPKINFLIKLLSLRPVLLWLEYLRMDRKPASHWPDSHSKCLETRKAECKMNQISIILIPNFEWIWKAFFSSTVFLSLFDFS
jgi:hypothetical protein